MSFSINTGTNIKTADCVKFTTSGHSVSCSTSTSNTLQMNFNAASTNQNIVGTISNFRNPYSRIQIIIGVGYYTNCGFSPINEIQSTFDQFASGSISTITLSSNSNTIGQENCILTLSFQPTTIMKPQGNIQFLVPFWYNTNQVVSNLFYMLDRTSVVSSSTSGVTVSGGSLASSTGTYSFSYSVTAGTDIVSGTTVTFKFTNFRNPISTSSVSGFSLFTLDADGNVIDLTTTSQSFSGVSDPATISSTSSSVQIYDDGTTTSDTEVGKTGRNLFLSFTVNVPLEVNCYIKITFPDNFKIDVDENLVSYLGSGFLKTTSSSQALFSSSSLIKKSYASGNYVLIPSCFDSSQLGKRKQDGTIQFARIVSGTEIRTVGSFTIDVAKDQAMTTVIATGTITPSLTLTSGQLTLNSFTPVSTSVQANTNYFISFTLTSGLFSDSYIEIDLPTNIDTTSITSCTIVARQNILSDALCSYSSGTFTITKAFTDSSTNGWDFTSMTTAITLTIKSDAKNPYSVQSAGSWSVRTFNMISGTPRAVDSGTTTTSFTTTQSTFTSVNTAITVSDPTTYINTATYAFQFTLSKRLDSGSKFVITYPSSDVDNVNSQRSCEVTVSSTTNTLSSCSFTGGTMTMTTTSNIALGSTVVLTVGGFRSPRTFQPTSAFTIQTQDSSGNIIESGTGFIATMSKTNTISSLVVTPTNVTNGGNGPYSLRIVSTNIPFQSGDQVSIQFPPEILFNTSGGQSCLMKSPTSSSTACSVSGTTLTTTITLSSSTATASTVEFSVTNIKNPPNLKTSSVFTNIQSFVMSGGNKYSISALSTTTATVKNTQPANILKYSLDQTTTAFSTEATYTITFTPTNPISQSGAVKINWPSQVTVDTSTFTATITTNKAYTDAYQINANLRQLIFTKMFNTIYSSEIKIEMGPIVNPKSSLNLNGFIINTYDDESLTNNIDVLKDNILKPGSLCNDPCATCSISNKSDCFTCWNDTGVPFLMKYSGFGTCLPKCPLGFTSNGENTKRECIACDISCIGCADNGGTSDKFKCINCASGYNFKTSDSRCLKSCSDGYYQVTSTTCANCSSPCKSCSGSATSCTQCFPGSSFPYLILNTCVNICPAGYVQMVDTCDKCQSPCLTCKNSPNFCTLCDPTSGKNYLYGGICYSTCPDGTTANANKGICEGCLAGCKICDSFSQEKCLLCSSGLYLHNSECLTDCPKNYQVNFYKTECVSLQNFPLVPFPFLIICLIMVGVSIGAYVKDKKSIILTNIILLCGPIEFLSFLTQLGLSFIFSNYEYAALSLVALLVYALLNVAFTIYFVQFILKRDSDYRRWATNRPKTFKVILIISAIFSFKLLKLHYSYLFGNDHLKANFSHPEYVTKSMIAFTVVHIVLSNGPIIAFDLSGLIFEYEWGSQFYIIMIETLLISIVMIILEIAELIKLKYYLKESPGYQQVYSDSVMNVSEMGDQSYDKKMREDMLKSIMGKVKGNQDLFLNNKLDDLFSKFGNRRCNSMIQFDNDKEKDPRLTKSLPNSPTSVDFDKEAYMNERFGNNVYAESQPPNPLGRHGKEFSDADTQVKSGDIGKILARKGGDFVNFEGSESSRRKDKKNRRRGRKNQYYTQIDAEDDEELEHNNDYGDENGDLDVIREEDEQEEQRLKEEKRKQKEEEEKRLQLEEQKRQQLLKEEAERKRKEDELREQEEKINQERERQELLEKQRREEQDRLHKIEEERLLKEQEELERQRKLQEEAQNQQELFQIEAVGQGEQSMNLAGAPQNLLQASARNDIKEQIIAEDDGTEDIPGLQQNVLIEDSLNDFQKMLNQNDASEIQVPPDAQRRNFNENDILGDFDRDEKGNVIVLQDENGNYVDKLGRRVNERGYLIQPQTGDIVEGENMRKMFDQKDMDERGEVPAPFCVEKYNFNPFNIRGNFDYDKQGRPIILQNKQKELVDKQGRRINKNSWLIDNKGNIVDIYGRKKFDKKQLANDGQELPKLFNYGGRRFDIMDICGQFDKDPNTGNIILRRNKNGQTTDNLGRLVNEKGYLVDQNENIINKEGKKIFDKKHLKQGEIPKIFPFTKFKVKNVMGNFEMDPLGNPILDKNANGELLDRDGKIVNARGYLINKNGDVIDKYGKVMFDKEILDHEGEIPKVFRTGLLKSDTASSLSRLMSEIEKNQPFEESDHQRIQNELAKYKKDPQQQDVQRRDSAGTSMDSMMGDTPSNYNIANQRFEAQQKLRQNALNKRNHQQIVEEDDSQYGDEIDPQMRKRRLKKKKKKQLTYAYKDPSDKDIQMAKAYGGQARGSIVKNPPKSSNRLMTADSQGIVGNAKNLSKLAGSISGYQKDLPQNSNMSRERIEFREGNQTNQSFMDGTNEPSIMAVPDHHIREQRLKQRKMNELKRKTKLAGKKGKGGIGGDPDFEKMFGKDIDEFLEDSDWDIESFGKMSNFSKNTSRSAFGDGRIRGLESIYLQRIETSMKKGPKGLGKGKQSKPNFRAMQDRFIEEQDIVNDRGIVQRQGLGQDNSSEMSNGARRNRNLKFMDSANTTAMAQNRSDANILMNHRKAPNQTQYRPGNEFKANRFDL